MYRQLEMSQVFVFADRRLRSSPEIGRDAAEAFKPVKLSPDLEESMAVIEPRSPDMLSP